MLQNIQDCKEEKTKIENQIAELLTNFCAKYGVILHKIEAIQNPLYGSGTTYWSGKVKLHIAL